MQTRELILFISRDMKLISITINKEERFLFKGMEFQYALKYEEIKMVKSKEYSLYGPNDHLLILSFIPDGGEEIALKETIHKVVMMEGIRALICTKDYTLSAGVEARLAPLGCTTKIAFDDREVLESLWNFEPDVVVTDRVNQILIREIEGIMIKLNGLFMGLYNNRLIPAIFLGSGEERIIHKKIQALLPIKPDLYILKIVMVKCREGGLDRGRSGAGVFISYHTIKEQAKNKEIEEVRDFFCKHKNGFSREFEQNMKGCVPIIRENSILLEKV